MPDAAHDNGAYVKPLAVVEWEAGEYAIGYSGAEPIFYFGDEHKELAGRLVAAYNENAINHVCKIIQYQPASETWECVECGQHHLTR